MTSRCENCGKEVATLKVIDGYELCLVCGYKIEAAKAQKQYWEAKQEIF